MGRGDLLRHGVHQLLHNLVVPLGASLDGSAAGPQGQSGGGRRAPRRRQSLLEGAKEEGEDDVEQGQVREEQLHTLPCGVLSHDVVGDNGQYLCFLVLKQ